MLLNASDFGVREWRAITKLIDLLLGKAFVPHFVEFQISLAYACCSSKAVRITLVILSTVRTGLPSYKTSWAKFNQRRSIALVIDLLLVDTFLPQYIKLSQFIAGTGGSRKATFKALTVVRTIFTRLPSYKSTSTAWLPTSYAIPI